MQETYEIGKAHSQAALDSGFDSLRDGVHTALKHPYITYPTTFGVALLVVPGARRLLWRQTIGKLRSEEAVYKSAEVRSAHLQQSIDGFNAEAQKLSERLAAAQEQYSSGLSKMKATNRQLQSLLSTVQKSESKATSLLEDLRELPSAQALKLRASVALQLAAAKRQTSALDKQIHNLYSKGF